MRPVSAPGNDGYSNGILITYAEMTTTSRTEDVITEYDGNNCGIARFQKRFLWMSFAPIVFINTPTLLIADE